MYIQYHILGRHVILMLCLNLMLGPTYLPYFFWQQTETTHIFHLGLKQNWEMFTLFLKENIAVVLIRTVFWHTIQ